MVLDLMQSGITLLRQYGTWPNIATFYIIEAV